MDAIIRRQSEQIIENQDFNSFDNEANYMKWEITYLRQAWRNIPLNNYYNRYVEELQKSSLSLFLVIHICVNLAHIIAVVSMQGWSQPDVYLYILSILLVSVSLVVTFKVTFVEKYRWFPYAISYFALVILILTDLLIPIYHAAVSYTRPALRPSYGWYILFAIYIFFPLTEIAHTVLMGFVTSTCYVIVLTFVTYQMSDETISKVSSEAVAFLCLNFIGIYYRYMNEIAIRQTFVDRWEYLYSNNELDLVKDQEQNLLLNILPKHASHVLQEIIKELVAEHEKKFKKKVNKGKLKIPKVSPLTQSIYLKGGIINKHYVERHDNVSILYADIVNYTKITTKLPVQQLVQILHALFLKFDQASLELDVLRIKFLGDCYYCVSGVPISTSQHAENCVKLGFRMIQDIRHVRSHFVRYLDNIDIDMRIGVHSGSVTGGIIGACKWQYDIWSKDVDIANKMESTGRPGKVHISQQTLNFLERDYIFEEGTQEARNDPVLKEHKITTYLISPQINANYEFTLPDDIQSIANRRASQNISTLLRRNTPKMRPSDLSSQNLRFTTLIQINEITSKSFVDMEKELKRMPIGRLQFHKYLFKSTLDDLNVKNSSQKRKSNTQENLKNISAVFLLFKNNFSLEFKYLKEHDPLIIYSVVLSSIILLAIIIIQIINKPTGILFWVVSAISILLSLVIIPLTWFKKIWFLTQPLKEVPESEDDDYYKPLIPEKPKGKYFLKCYNISDMIIKSAAARHGIFIFFVVTSFSCSLMGIIQCDFDRISTDLTLNIDSSICQNPWAITHSIVLTTCICFLFLRIHFILKFLIGFATLAVYGIIIFDVREFLYENQAATNKKLNSNVSHFLTILASFVILHLIDRQSEYINRVDYNYKQQLLEKRYQAEFTKISYSRLLHNVLPAHVAEIYLNTPEQDGFYHEIYDNVAIIFAKIMNFNHLTDKHSIELLNRIICDFDEILLKFESKLRIEKIKLSGWTYMAACGLEPGRSSSGSIYGSGPTQSLSKSRRITNDFMRRSRITSVDSVNIRKLSTKTTRTSNPVLIIVEFAIDIMKALVVTNREIFKTEDPGLLRIGISHGEVMAGVIGFHKPLYDVWGNTVNMASRMESTGIPNRIQVTKETADVITSFGYACEYRKEVFVKGRGEIPTYFVQTDENYNLIKTKTKRYIRNNSEYYEPNINDNNNNTFIEHTITESVEENEADDSKNSNIFQDNLNIQQSTYIKDHKHKSRINSDDYSTNL